MLVQYISDLHLHKNKRVPKIIPNAPILAILGDIGDPYERIYSEFLADMSKQFKLVLFVAGNHEFYNYSMPSVIIQLKKVASRFNNVLFLNNEAIIVDGVVFVGTTLWSNIKDEDAIGVNDFKYIRNFNIEDFRLLHFEAVSFIRSILREPFEKVIILSHHAPHKIFNGDYTTKLSAFTTDLNELIQDPVKAWLCGHSHINLETVVNYVKLASNCLGYIHENTYFNPGKYIKI